MVVLRMRIGAGLTPLFPMLRMMRPMRRTKYSRLNCELCRPQASRKWDEGDHLRREPAARIGEPEESKAPPKRASLHAKLGMVITVDCRPLWRAPSLPKFQL